MNLSEDERKAVNVIAQHLGVEFVKIDGGDIYFSDGGRPGGGLRLAFYSAEFEAMMSLAWAIEENVELISTALKLKIANQAQQIRQLNGAIERRNRKINGLRVKNADLKQALDSESEAVDNLLANFNDVPKPKKEPKLIASADPIRGVTIYDHGFWGADVTLFGGEV